MLFRTKARRKRDEGATRHAQSLARLPDPDTGVPQATWETPETCRGLCAPLVVQRPAVASVSTPARSLEEASIPIWSVMVRGVPGHGWRIFMTQWGAWAVGMDLVLSPKCSMVLAAEVRKGIVSEQRLWGWHFVSSSSDLKLEDLSINLEMCDCVCECVYVASVGHRDTLKNPALSSVLALPTQNKSWIRFLAAEFFRP